MTDKLRLLSTVSLESQATGLIRSAVQAKRDNSSKSPSMETAASASDVDFDVFELAQDPVLSDAEADTHPVPPSMLSAGPALKEDFDMTGDIDLLVEECLILGSPSQLHAFSYYHTSHDDMATEESDWEDLAVACSPIDYSKYPSVLGGFRWKPNAPTPYDKKLFDRHDDKQSPPPPSPIPLLSPNDDHHIVTPTKFVKSIVMQPKAAVVKVGRHAKFKIPRQVKYASAPPSPPTATTASTLRPPQAIVGPESEQMKTILRMIVYMQETLASDFCDNAELQRRSQVLSQLAALIQECLVKHLKGQFYFKHLPGSIFERMVEIMNRDDWLHVFEQSKTYEHKRLTQMGANHGGSLCYETWKTLLWDHESTTMMVIHGEQKLAAAHTAPCSDNGKLQKMMMARKSWGRAKTDGG